MALMSLMPHMALKERKKSATLFLDCSLGMHLFPV